MDLQWTNKNKKVEIGGGTPRKVQRTEEKKKNEQEIIASKKEMNEKN